MLQGPRLSPLVAPAPGIFSTVSVSRQDEGPLRLSPRSLSHVSGLLPMSPASPRARAARSLFFLLEFSTQVPAGAARSRSW